MLGLTCESAGCREPVGDMFFVPFPRRLNESEINYGFKVITPVGRLSTEIVIESVS